MKGLWFIVLIWLGLLPTGIAQNTQIVQTHSLSVADGLLSNTINVLYEDSRGVVWIGTDCGVNSYDGINIKSYTQKKDGLAENSVTFFNEDLHGNIWVVTKHQIGDPSKYSVINPVTDEVKTIQDYCSFNNQDIQRIEGNYDQTIWLTTGHSIYEYNGDSVVFIATEKRNHSIGSLLLFKASSTEIAYIKADYNKGDTLCKVDFYDYKQHQELSHSFLKKDGFLFNVTISQNNVYWSYRFQDSLIIYNKPPQENIHIVYKGLGQPTNNSFPINNNHFFIIKNKKIHCFDRKGALVQVINTGADTYFNNYIFIDDRFGVWFKEDDQLRYVRYVTSPFQTYDLTGSRPEHFFRGGRGIAKLQDSLLFVGSVVPYFRKKVTDSLYVTSIENSICGVHLNHKNELLVGVQYNTIKLIDSTGKEIKSYFCAQQKGNFLPWSILEDSEQKIWVGTNLGFHYVDAQIDALVESNQYNQFEELTGSSIFHIHEEGDKLFLCTSIGLYLWDKQKGAEACYLKGISIAHLHKDKEGIFWLASKGDGLIRFDLSSKQHQAFTTENGLAHNTLYAVYEDDFQNLWMSSNWGIMRFDKQTYDVTSYVKENGFLDNEFNTVSHHQDKDGKLYFGSQKGVVIFDPKDIVQSSDTFPLLITLVNKFNQSTDSYENILATVLQKNNIELNPEDNGFQLTLSLLDYRNPKLHQYAYKVEGFNKDWKYQSNPIISISQLPYGAYQLRVKVKGVSGNWVELKNPINITVFKPFYLQWWFLIALVIVGILLIYWLIQFRTRQLVQQQKNLETIIESRTQKIAQQAEDLKALDKVKSRFFANISHELRTPLTLILGPISSLLKSVQAPDLDKNKLNSGLLRIKKNGEGLLSLVEEILDLSKMEVNKLDVVEGKIHLDSYVPAIFNAFQKQASYLGIHYSLKLETKDNLSVLLDENKVTKMLNNLLSNALKFTPSGKSVQLTVKDKETTLAFIVKDTGEGIHPTDLPHVFERFYQSKQPNRPAQGGTGIGLALVAEFAKLLNGSVSVDSTWNKGSTFEILLPKQAITWIPDALIEETIFNTIELQEEDTFVTTEKKATILLVEDHAEMRSFISSLLDHDYTIITATNGLEGLTVLEEKADSIDLILSDVMMPKMDGFEMLQKIKSTLEWCNIPMIMLTARAAEQDKVAALTIGVDDYLTKPFSVEELTARIKNLLENYWIRKQWLQEQIGTKAPVEEISPVLPEVDTLWVKELETIMLTEIDNEQFNATDFAKKMNLSEGYLRRKLKKITGLTPTKMLKIIRLDLARTYLEIGKYQTVKEVAYSVGFQTADSFSKSYKAHFGKLPSDYFKLLQE